MIKSLFGRRGRVLSLLVFVGSHVTLVGCGDNSRTTGTMVETSDEVLAYRKSKVEAYKGGPPKKAKKGKSAGKKY